MAAALTAEELNKLGQQTGYKGPAISNVGLQQPVTAPSSQPPTGSMNPNANYFQPTSNPLQNPNANYFSQPNTDAQFQKMANTNPEMADSMMDKAGYTTQADPNINQAWQLGTYDQRTKLAQQYGIQNYTGTADQNTQLVQKYKSGFQSAQSSGQPVPKTVGEGSAMVSSYTGGLTQTPEVNPMDTILAQDQGYQKLLQDYKKYTDSNMQKESLVSEYQRLQKEAGLPELNKDMVNMKNIIEGTEDDIRTEITKAGGFATESQVLALTGARNKNLIKDYNRLIDTYNSAKSNVSTLIGLSQQDREYADQQFKTQLDFDKQILDYQQKMKQNATEAYNKIIEKTGYGGLYQATGGDPYAVNLIEKTMGLAPGSLAQLSTYQAPLTEKDELDLDYKRAQIEDLKSPDLQFVSGTENQPSGYFDKKTGKFTTIGGGGGTSGGQVLGATTGNTPQDIKTAISTYTQSKDIPAAARTQLAKALTVLNKLQTISDTNKEKFPGGVIGGQISRILPDALKSKSQAALDADVAKLRQDLVNYITGATYTSLQEKDVNKLIPQTYLNNQQNRDRVDKLFNTMIGDIEAALVASGVNAQIPKIDSLFTASLDNSEIAAMDSILNSK